VAGPGSGPAAWPAAGELALEFDEDTQADLGTFGGERTPPLWLRVPAGVVVPGANLTPGDPQSFLGRGIIVQEKVDDGGQPVGNAGGRIGCSEIK
jgi:hypothetical protein